MNSLLQAYVHRGSIKSMITKLRENSDILSDRKISNHKREKYELWGKWETMMGAPDEDDFEDLLSIFDSFDEQGAFASSETCDDDDGNWEKPRKWPLIVIVRNEGMDESNKKTGERKRWSSCFCSSFVALVNL